jgi:hypothetical protein
MDSPYLEMRESPGRGRGCFARAAIPSRATLTVSPVLVFPAAEYAAHGAHTQLAHYAFVWRDAQPPSMALALGLGSIFNHAREPNAGWLCDIPGRLLRYVALRDIAEGEEVFICYGGEGRLWFEDAGEEGGAAAAGGGGGSGGTGGATSGAGAAAEGAGEGVSLLQAAFAGVEPLGEE